MSACCDSLTGMGDKTYPETQISDALNRACDDIIDAADLPDTGTRDALNLLVNATMVYLETPNATLSDVVANYDENDLDTVLSWITD